MTILKKSVLILLLLSIFISNKTLFSQEIPQSVKNTGVYDFLDELANNQIIEINSAIKPYSRLFISNRLREADEKREQLTPRQQKELDFYLMDFGKEFQPGKDWKRRTDLFYYKDTLFSLTINPILGGEIFTNSSDRQHTGEMARKSRLYWKVGLLCLSAR